MKDEQPFKTCPGCQHTWATQDEFLADPLLLINGYQANFDSLPDGLFKFTHTIPGCHATISIKTEEFLDLYTGPRYTKNKANMPGCPLYCMNENQLDRCDQRCECAYVREVLSIIANRRKPDTVFEFTQKS